VGKYIHNQVWLSWLAIGEGAPAPTQLLSRVIFNPPGRDKANTCTGGTAIECTIGGDSYTHSLWKP